jgi:hypothetical protein
MTRMSFRARRYRKKKANGADDDALETPVPIALSHCVIISIININNI